MSVEIEGVLNRHEVDQSPVKRKRIIEWLSKPITPYVVGGLFILGALIGTGKIQVPVPSLGDSPKVVTFDPVLFMNSQRAAASILAVNHSPDLALTISRVAKQAEDVIREEAEGSLVLVKQSVVLDDYPDITLKVLKRFGLPTSVPTVNNKLVDDSALEQIAPTDMAFGVLQEQEDKREQFQGQSGVIEKELQLLDKQLNMLP